VTAREFKRWLQKQGCTFEPWRGGHLTVRRGDRISTLPMHGKQKELKTGTVQAIKKDLGLKEGSIMEYRATLTRDDDTILISFPDLPGAHSFGDDEADALSHGRDAMITIIEAHIKDRRPVPLPRPGAGPRVGVPALLAAKVALHNEMLRQNVSKSELGRRLDQHLPQIDRLVDVRHHSKLDQLEAAFAALGKQLSIDVHDAPKRRPGKSRGRQPARAQRSKASGRAVRASR